MGRVKIAGLGLLLAVTLLGAGYLWGARGRWTAEEQLAVANRQAAVADARRLTLAGQMALVRLNFGEASGLFESARAAAQTAAGALEQDSLTDLAAEAGRAAQALTEARGLASKLDQAASGKAGDALAILDRIGAALPQPDR